MKDYFFVFLDIDGVLTDIDCGIHPRTGLREFKPESVEVLNYLIKKLEEQYIVRVVITSSLIAEMGKLMRMFRIYNVECDHRIWGVPDGETRGEQIKKFLRPEPKETGYVIIDDDYHDFLGKFDAKRLIKTSRYEGGLSMQLVEDFLASLPKIEVSAAGTGTNPN